MNAWFTVDEMNAWAEKKLKENPHWNEAPEKTDIPDLIAGALGVSRGTAYDLMREALAEAQPSKTWVGLTDEEVEGLLPPADGSAEENKVRVEVQPGIWGVEYEEVDAWSLPLVRQAIRAIEAKLKEKNT